MVKNPKNILMKFQSLVIVFSRNIDFKHNKELKNIVIHFKILFISKFLAETFCIGLTPSFEK
jgi:hypothetical protein